MRSAAFSYWANAAFRLLRSMKITPAALAAGPKIGIRASSDFAIHLLRGSTPARAKTS
jgi:hypothetical protein